MPQRSGVPRSCAPLFLSSSSPPSPSVVSARCFSAKPASTRMRRLAHSSPKSPLSHGIDVSRAPAVKQWRLRLGRQCQAMRVRVPPRAGEQHSPPSRNRHIASTRLPAPGHKTQPDPRRGPSHAQAASGARRSPCACPARPPNPPRGEGTPALCRAGKRQSPGAGCSRLQPT